VTRVRCGLLACIGLWPVAATAQTDDPVFGNWRSTPLAVGSRAAGMGGAFVAIADDARAAVVNPAGLTQIPVKEISAASGRPWFSVATGLRQVRFAAYYTKAEQEPPEPRPGAPRLTLVPSVWEAGAAAGFQPFRRLRLGASVAYRHLTIEEEGRIPTEDAPVDALVGGKRGRVGMSAGALIDLIPATVVGGSPLKLGLSFQPGVSWSIPRVTSDVELRRPSVGSIGLAWRASSFWSLTAQGDLIRYQEVVDTLRRNVGDTAARDFRLDNVMEPRLGVEFATPLRCGCGTVKVRAGVHYESPGTLEFSGSDEARRNAFPVRSWRTTMTLGGSFFAEHFGNALRVDVDSLDVLDGPALSVGVVWRF